MKRSNHTISDRLPPGSTRTTPFTVHQDGGVKFATGASSKIRWRGNIAIGTWNTRTLRVAGKLQELAHEMDKYRWNILGLFGRRWKKFGETTEERHEVSFSGKSINTSMVSLQWHREHCHGMSPDLQQAHHYPPEGSPVQYHSCTSVHPNVKLIWWQRSRRILWPATEYHWLDAEEGYSCSARRLECKWGQECLWKLARLYWPFCNDDRHEKGFSLLKFATFNDLVLANTFGHHKTTRRWTWHSPNR